MLGGVFGRIEGDRSPLAYWALSFLGIIFFRNLLEGALVANYLLASPGLFLIDYPLSYTVLLLGLLVLLRLLTGSETKNVFKVLTVFFLLILIVPPIDYALEGGEGRDIGYVMGDAGFILRNFVTFYEGVGTTGQRVEGVLFEILLFAYVFGKTRSVPKALFGVFAAYAILMLWAAFPSLIYLISSALLGAPAAVAGDGSLDIGLAGTYLSDSLLLLSMALLATALLAITLFISDRRISCFVRSLFRPLRTLHYLLLALFGLLLGHQMHPMPFLLHDLAFSFGFLAAVALVYQFAASANDLFDRDLHTRLKKPKPVAAEGLKFAAAVFLGLAALLGVALGAETLMLLVSFAALAFLYSAPPIRLKRFPIVASFTLALCALLIALAGFAVFAGDAAVDDFPGDVALMMLVVYTLGTNYKDLKDAKQDRADKVYTIPVVLGEKKGRIAVALMTAVSFFLVPFILGIPKLILPALAAALLAAFIAIRGLNEKYFRIMHLAYFMIVAYVILA